jgi:hypothetical protein
VSVQLKPPSYRRLQRALDALFREARLLERRRRRRYAALALAGCAAAAAVAFGIAGSGGSSPAKSGDRPVSVAVSSVTLPQSGDYFSLAVVGGRLIVSGGPQGSLFPSGSTGPLSHGRASGICDAATVDPLTLKLSDVSHANCGDPALYGVRALAVSYLLRGTPPSGGTGTFAIRIARVDPSAPDGYTLGPIVATYPQCSDCGPQWIYGDGSLWIYDPLDGGGASPPGELLRVSETTGTVQQRWVMPEITRALLAVNADGLWLAPSNESGWPSRTPASELVLYWSLYRVSPGARAPSRVFTIGSDGALWLVASGHTVWLEARRMTKGSVLWRSVLWRLDGKHATPTLQGLYPANTNQGAEFGAGAPTYAGNAAIGIYYVVNGSATQQIVRLSLDAASERSVATVKAPTSVTIYGPSPPAVALGGSFFFLDPPTLSYTGGTSAPVLQGAGVLYRVTPHAQQ